MTTPLQSTSEIGKVISAQIAAHQDAQAAAPAVAASPAVSAPSAEVAKPAIDYVLLASLVNQGTYEDFALRTAKHLTRAYNNLWHGACGIVTEVGELFDAYKRVRIYGKASDVVNLVEEIGDVLWYVNLHAYHNSMQLWETSKPDDDEIVTWHIEDYLINATNSIDGILAGMLTCAYRIFNRVAQDTIDGQKGDLTTDMSTLVYLCAALVNSLQKGTISVDLLGGVTSEEAVYYTLEDAMKANIVKLAKRYGDKFSAEAALNRNLTGERSMLEQSLNTDFVAKPVSHHPV